MADHPILISKKVVETFRSRVDRGSENSCWLWTGPINNKGYGRFHASGSSEMAHRTSVRLDGREIPDGLEVDHICGVRNCVNPSHLRVVTHRENLLSGNTITAAAASRTHCLKGHPLSGDNLAIRAGKRECRECNRARQFLRYTPTTARRRRPHLTKEEFLEVRRCIDLGQSHSEISKKMNLAISTISRVRNAEKNYGR